MPKNYHTENKSFMLYKDWEDLVDCLDSLEDAGRLLKALFAFAKRGEEAQFTGSLKMAYVIMRGAIERDGAKWDKTSKARSEATKRNRCKATNAAIAAIDNNCEQLTSIVYDTVTDTVIDTDTVTDKDKETVSSPSPCITPAEKHSLINDYGSKVAELYIQKLCTYISEKRNGKPYRDNAATVRRWIEEDKQSGRLSTSNADDPKSYDIDEYESWLKTYTPKLSNSE